VNSFLVSLVDLPWTPEKDWIVIKHDHEMGLKWVEIEKKLAG
jgi:hypothetical protein